MPLTDTSIRNAKPAAKPVKIFDTGGLFLIVSPAGGKWFRLRYSFGGKEKLLSLGIYPDVSLKDARERRDTARKQLAEGIDPGEDRKAAKAKKLERATNTFEAVAREWHKKMAASWVPAYGERMMCRFERDVFPVIGGKPIADIKPTDLLAALRKIEARGVVETAHRARSDSSQVFRYAISTGRVERDIAADLKGALTPKNVGHFASVTEPAKVAELLRALDRYQGSFIVVGAMKLVFNCIN